MSTVEQTTPTLVTDEPPLEVTVLIPCLNEAENIEQCVRSAAAALLDARLEGEVLVVDNASEDGSGTIAQAAGARVVVEPRRGYGSAYLAGFAAARGRYIVMADADLTYDFNEIPRFVTALADGADMAIGDRMDNIQPGAMPWLHRYIGNPLLSGLLNLFFRTGVRDAHCGMRAVRADVLPRLDLRTTGMEFASEMVIRASKEHMQIAEFPIDYHPRGGESKLSSFRDGWRHLRFLLVHSPTYLFVVPGALLAGLGTLISVLVLAGVNFFGRNWGLHTLIGGTMLMIVGTQVLALGLCAHAYGTYFMGEKDPWFDRMRARFRLEHGLLLGGAIFTAGLAAGVTIVVIWAGRGFGSLSQEKLALVALACIIVGIQIFFSSFLLSILGLRRNDRRADE
ncbi:MAG TPA: glycosyltransferase family 2 protein [Solirubrobacteraceae bacterium]|jgi:glycosyltransferase involved in cell wall biosynthesis|nr:glycosyltransferase family 2 protein [Solirubrobacteraceae bacterium]